MQILLDHVFILVEPGAKVADLLVESGFEESFSRDHPGQGTSNRRYEFANGMLEFLYVRDADEANTGPAANLNLPGRADTPNVSPFGLIIRRKTKECVDMPFEGWRYQPDYFEPPMAFHIGENSTNIHEPLCIYAPFIEPEESSSKEGCLKSISQVTIHLPANGMSSALKKVNSAEGLTIVTGSEHFLEIILDDNREGTTKDFPARNSLDLALVMVLLN